MFQAGKRIVCINDSFDPIQQQEIPNLPKQDEMYTVRDAFQVTRNGTASGIWAVHLVEIKNPMLPHPSGLGTFEPSFAATRFAEMNDEQIRAAEEVEKMVKELVEVETLEEV